MTVKELIEKLQEYSPEMQVLIEKCVPDECELSGERLEYDELDFDYYLEPKTRPFEPDKYNYNILVIK